MLEALEEHHLVDDIVEQLKDTPFDDEHHIKEEEGPMFTQVRQEFSKEELDELGSRMDASRQEQMKEAMPERDQVNL